MHSEQRATQADPAALPKAVANGSVLMPHTYLVVAHTGAEEMFTSFDGAAAYGAQLAAQDVANDIWVACPNGHAHILTPSPQVDL